MPYNGLDPSSASRSLQIETAGFLGKEPCVLFANNIIAFLNLNNHFHFCPYEPLHLLSQRNTTLPPHHNPWKFHPRLRTIIAPSPSPTSLLTTMPIILDSPPPSPTPPHTDANSERRRLHHEADIVIIGAGVLGCAAAITFARQGRSVILLEKSLAEPNRIVGELLQPGGVSALEKLGLRHCLEEIDAVRVLGYQVSWYGTPVGIPYPEEILAGEEKKGIAGGKCGRPEGRSFHHGRFIRRLRETAMQEENVMVVETTAMELVRCGYTGQVLGVECTTDGRPDYVC